VNEQPEVSSVPVIALRNVSKHFTGIAALSDVSLEVWPGQVLCLIGDNGAGKSTLIKILAGVHQPSSGAITVHGEEVRLTSPREAKRHGIATVHQEVGILELMSVARNFVLGAEPMKGWGPFRRLDAKLASQIALDRVQEIGIRRIQNCRQLGGTLSGGERQALAIARAMYLGARVLILDEPTSALGVREASTVLRMIDQAKRRGVAIIFITHNANHALAVGDKFIVLIRGVVAANLTRAEASRERVLDLMGGEEEALARLPVSDSRET
jgi:simple sugar transport system ATP-binding protein